MEERDQCVCMCVDGGGRAVAVAVAVEREKQNKIHGAVDVADLAEYSPYMLETLGSVLSTT